MAQSNWLTTNANRSYPFVTASDFTTSPVTVFPSNGAFLDASFNLGIDSNFEPGRDKLVLDGWRLTADTLYFSFVVVYGESADYDPFRCFRFVFAYSTAADSRVTSYAVPTRNGGPLGEDTEENPDLGYAFLTIGDVSSIVAALPQDEGIFASEPQVEPALTQTQHLMFVKNIRVANKSRVCPPECPCPEPPSSSSDSSLSSSAVSSSSLVSSSSSSAEPVPPTPSSSSSSSSEPVCTDPVPPEPTTAAVPTSVVLPLGTFLDDVKLKEGYNCEISVSNNVIQVSSRLFYGEGMPCDDLRMTDAGDFEENNCVVCSGWVKAVNGQGYAVSQLQLVGGPSVIVEPYLTQSRVVVRFQDEAVCEVDV